MLKKSGIAVKHSLLFMSLLSSLCGSCLLISLDSTHVYRSTIREARRLWDKRELGFHAATALTGKDFIGTRTSRPRFR
ncbi:uncharacterized protein LY79DRAFT_552147 [Colletotrichum navitas]|uniref:Secreted protein n=1 Tax=Colletotrichum navitas TaxID=681940 RepID=A0AAD8Q0H4_9PEZI|nr:uncharacterized protein LY79DRAFT_552147 [Colletotrichum navitas]KAK1593528.1 hypothetical protein LY79DRAFT_552147 [Colletotrichum navitas]